MQPMNLVNSALFISTAVLLLSGATPTRAAPDVEAANTVQTSTSETAQADVTVKSSLAVLPFAHKGGVTEADAGEILADLLLREASAADYAPVDGAQLITIESEPDKRSWLAIQSTEQAINLGREAGVRYLVFGELSRLGVNHYLNARVLDCQTGEVTAHGYVAFVSFDQINIPLRDLAVQLDISQPDAAYAPDTPAGSEAMPSSNASVESLYLDGKLTQEQAQIGIGLLDADAESLNEFDAMRRSYFMQILDGSLPTEQLQRALDLAAYAEQAHGYQIHQASDQARQTTINAMLETARAYYGKQSNAEAILALDELLELDPAHIEASVLRAEIALQDPPSKIGDTWTNSIGMTFAYIPAGKFMMGSGLSYDEVKKFLDYDPARFNNEYPQHKVILTKALGLATTEVTIEQFTRFVQESGHITTAEVRGDGTVYSNTGWTKQKSVSWRSPGFDQGNRHPVVQVSWQDAVAFTDWLSKREGRSYRLPSEAEWEYACRAGTSSTWSWGNLLDAGQHHANMADNSAEKWLRIINETHAHRGKWADGYVFTSPVGSFEPNAWGLYDMQGNVLESCFDTYGAYPSDTVTDPKGPPNGRRRVSRGGSWMHTPAGSRPATRHKISADYRSYHLGFRIAVDWDAERESSSPPASSPGRR